MRPMTTKLNTWFFNLSFFRFWTQNQLKNGFERCFFFFQRCFLFLTFFKEIEFIFFWNYLLSYFTFQVMDLLQDETHFYKIKHFEKKNIFPVSNAKNIKNCISNRIKLFLERFFKNLFFNFKTGNSSSANRNTKNANRNRKKLTFLQLVFFFSTLNLNVFQKVTHESSKNSQFFQKVLKKSTVFWTFMDNFFVS